MELDANKLVFDSERAFRAVIDRFLLDYPECSEDLEQVFFSWANIEETVRRTAFFLSMLPCAEDDTQPLIVQALKKAVIASGHLAGYQTYAPFLRAFIGQLSEGLAAISIYGMSTDGKQERWELCGPYLCQWAASFDTIVVIRNETASVTLTRATELILTARLLTAYDLALQLEQADATALSSTNPGRP